MCGYYQGGVDGTKQLLRRRREKSSSVLLGRVKDNLSLEGGKREGGCRSQEKEICTLTKGKKGGRGGEQLIRCCRVGEGAILAAVRW